MKHVSIDTYEPTYFQWKEGRLFNGGTVNVAGWSKQIIEKL